LISLPLNGGDSISLSSGLDMEIGNVALSDARDPFAAQPPRITADGRSMLVLTSRNGRVEVVRFPASSGEPAVVVGGDREVAAFSASRDGQRLACAISDPTHPYEVFTIDRNQERRLSSENDALLETRELLPAEPFQVSGSDGQAVNGWVIKPPGF